MRYIALSMLLLGLLAPQASLGDPWADSDASLFVPGTTDTLNPVDTGVFINAGNIMRTLSMGAVSWGQDPSPFCVTGPSGSASDISGSVAGAPFNCLVAKIGDGPWFALGEMYQRSGAPEGELYLAINDSNCPDNIGSYFVSIWQSPNPAAIPPPDPQASLGISMRSAPNPFSRMAEIRYAVPARGVVTLRILNVEGALMRTLVNASMEPGDYMVRWDGRDERGNTMPNGTYFYQITQGDYVTAEKTLLLR